MEVNMTAFLYNFVLREGPQKPFFGKFSQIWVGGVAESQTPQITPKIAFFDANFTFRFPKSHKNPGVGEWINRFGETFPPQKNGFILGGLPSYCKPLFGIVEVNINQIWSRFQEWT